MNGDGWQLECVRPLGLAALVVLPLLVVYWRRGLVHFARWQQVVSLGCRALLVLLLALALAGVGVKWADRRPFVVFAVDRSASVGPVAQGAAERFVAAAIGPAEADRAVVVPFGRVPGEAARGDAEGRGADVAPDHRSATDLGLAVAAARRAIPADWPPRIVLLSDGNETLGDGLEAARAVGVPVWSVPLHGVPEPEALVEQVVLPGTVRLGRPFQVEVGIRASTPGTGTLRLRRGALEPRVEPVVWQPGVTRFPFEAVADAEGWQPWLAELETDRDTLPENNALGAAVFVLPKARVLVADGQPSKAEPLAEALRAADFDVEVVEPERLPDTAATLGAYQLVVLSNVPADALGDERMAAVVAFARRGGGLLVVGGDRGLTPGGYGGTPLEDALPVVCQPRDDKPRPVLALVLVIDVSGSMQGAAIELARQATRRAVEALAPDDLVGVLAFEDRSRWISEIHPCSDKQTVLDRIDTIRAGGGTSICPALEKAHLALREAYADRKHILLLSDGVSHPGDFRALVEEIAAAGITLSAVGVGDEAAKRLLDEMAEAGGGKYYFCERAEDLPEVFEIEAATAVRPGITEEPLFARPADEAEFAATFDGLDPRQLPVLLGYAETRLRPEGRLWLRTEAGDPLLTSWDFGRGRSVVFTSDAHPRWAAAWLGRPEFGRFWVAAARYAVERDQPAPLRLRAARAGRRGVVLLDTATNDGRAGEASGVELLVSQPGREPTAMPMSRLAPDRHLYAAVFEAPPEETFFLEARLAVSDPGAPRVAYGSLGAGYAEEYRARPTNEPLLRAMAEASGGRYNPEPKDVFSPAGEPVVRTAPLGSWLLAAVLLLLVADVALKRIDLTPNQGGATP